MKKRKKPKRAQNVPAKKQVVTRDAINIQKEADYIVQRAQFGESRIIRLGTFVLFSTETGDAWLLDIEDELALCLAREGERLPFRIIDTPTQFGIEWAAKFFIENEMFVVMEYGGKVRSIFGYPTNEILQALKSEM